MSAPMRLAVVFAALFAAGCGERGGPESGEDAAMPVAGSTAGSAAPMPETAAGSCAGIADPVDAEICRDDYLRELDAELARMQQRAVATAAHQRRSDIRAAHARWRRTLADCADVPPESRHACIDEKYQSRLRALK